MTEPNLDFASSAVAKRPDAANRRTRLREFQAQLVERMQAASSGTATQLNQLGVMIGQRRWLLSLQEAGEIVSVGTIAKVPLTQDWFLGLTNIRGNLVSVIDLANFQGMARTPVDKESRIVAFSPMLSFNSGLLVSRVMGLRNIGDMEPQLASETGEAPWSVKHYRDRDSQVWTELKFSLIMQDPQFLHVGL